MGSSNYKKSGHKNREPQMQVSSSGKDARRQKERAGGRSFGDLAARAPAPSARQSGGGRGDAVGAKEVTFAPTKVQKKRPGVPGAGSEGRDSARGKPKQDRRSASNNTFRGM